MLLVRLDAGIGHAVSLPGLVLVGLFVGYFAGMFGVGGGFLLTPALMYAFGVPPPVAVGSALAQKCGTSIASFLKYRKLKRGEPKIDLIMLGGSLIGVDAGSRLLGYLSHLPPLTLPTGHHAPAVSVVLDLLFIVLLSWTAIFVFRESMQTRKNGAQSPESDETIPGPLVTRVRIPPYVNLPGVGLYQVSIPLLTYIGFGLGVASGIMGIGGGVLFLPILMYGLGLSARNAAGTGVLLLSATVAVATVEQALKGYVAIKLAMAILIGSSVGSQLGALTTNVLPNRVLRQLFAILVAATVGMIIWDFVGLLQGKAG